MDINRQANTCSVLESYCPKETKHQDEIESEVEMNPFSSGEVKWGEAGRGGN